MKRKFNKHCDISIKIVLLGNPDIDLNPFLNSNETVVRTKNRCTIVMINLYGERIAALKLIYFNGIEMFFK